MGTVFVGLMILGCLLISVCITVLTFTAVEMRRTLTKMVVTIGELADRNFAAIQQLQKRQRRSDDDPPGGSTFGGGGPS
jgi:hypothetical protein